MCNIVSHGKKPVACSAAVVALISGMSAGALGQQAMSLLDRIKNAVGQDDPVVAIEFLAPIFNANTDSLIELASEAASEAKATDNIPSLCRPIMRTASQADPERIGDIAAAVLSVAPECEEQVAAVLAEGVQPAAGPSATQPLAARPLAAWQSSARPPASPDASTGPTPSPITPPSSTAESPSTDVASPTDPT